MDLRSHLRRLLRYGSDGRWRTQFVPPHGRWAGDMRRDGIGWLSAVSPMGDTMGCLRPSAVRGNGDDQDLLVVLFAFGTGCLS